MNGETLHMPVSDDRQAMRRIIRHFDLRIVLFALIWGGGPLTISAATGRLGGSFIALFVAWIWLAACRGRFSGAVMHLLPVRKRSLGKIIWQTVLFYPMLLMAVLFLFGAWCSVMFFHASVPEAGGNVALALVQLLALLGIMTAGTCLRGAFGIWTDNGLVRVPPKRVNVQLLGMLNVAAVGAWVLLTSPGYAGRELVAALCAVVGVAGAISAYHLREHLVEDALRRRGKSGAGPGNYDFGRSVPRFGRGILVRHFLGTALWSVIVAGAVALFIGHTLSGHGIGAGIVSLGMLFSGSISCLVVGWGRWSEDLREWRMLPLSRLQLGERISGITVAACIIPWLATLFLFGIVGVYRNVLTVGECAFCIGLSAILQGVLLTVIPLALRRFESMTVTALLLCVAGLIFIFLFLPVAAYSNEIAAFVQSRSVDYGWPLLAVGIVLLCIGGMVSAWHASRVLLHSDCYRKATE